MLIYGGSTDFKSKPNKAQAAGQPVHRLRFVNWSPLALLHTTPGPSPLLLPPCCLTASLPGTPTYLDCGRLGTHGKLVGLWMGGWM